MSRSVRSSTDKVYPNSVWSKRNVNTRNQRNVLTHADRQRFYGFNADKQGETLIDIKNRIKFFHLRLQATKLTGGQ